MKLSDEQADLLIKWCESNGTDPLDLDDDDKASILAIIKSEPTWREWF